MLLIKYVRQHDAKDCAAACLSSVFNLYGIKISMIRMRELLRIDKNGSSMYALSEVAAGFGFETDVMHGEWTDMLQSFAKGKIRLPVICHEHIDGTEHFVIIKKITDKAVWIFDPGRGHIKYTHDLFCDLWTGYILNLSPSEKIKKNRTDNKQFHCYAKILVGMKGKFAGILCLSFLIAGLSIVYSYIYRNILDRFVLDDGNVVSYSVSGFSGQEILLREIRGLFQNLPYLFGIMIFCIVAQFIFSLIRGGVLACIGKSMDTELSKQFVSKLFRLPFSYFQQWETGELLVRYQDMNFIRDAISGSVLTITFETVMAVAGFIILIQINRSLFIIVLIMVLIYFAIVMLYRRPMQHLNRRIMEEDAKVTSGIKEGIDGIAVIKLFSQEKSYGSKVIKCIENFIASTYKGNILNISQSEILVAVQGLGMVFVLWRGTVCVLQGSMTLGTLFLFISLMGYFISPIQNLIGLQPLLQEAWIAGDRLNDVFEATPEDKLHSGKSEISIFQGDISYQNVFFRYGYHKWILKNVTFTIKEGEHIALTGANGSGKSTLAKLLVGMYEPENGSIMVGKYNIRELKLDCIRKNIIYVSQEPAILSGTIREGILFGNQKKIRNSAFQEVIKGCFIDEMVSDNPFGFEWFLSENGTNISGGYKQRIAIARALLADPDILILDEATSQIDINREHEILDFIFRYRAGRTIIVITHDRKIVKKCDREIHIELANN